jgi:hypothetical protein
MEVEDYERSSAAALRLQHWYRRDFQRLLRRRRAGQRIAAGCRQMLMVYASRNFAIYKSSFCFSIHVSFLKQYRAAIERPGVCCSLSFAALLLDRRSSDFSFSPPLLSGCNGIGMRI